MVINTNVSAQSSARLLSESSGLLSKSLARLSSGSKLINPEDDVAGLAVSMRFDAQINRITAANSNVSNAISYSQTQDGFLKKVSKALDRMSELSVLAQDVTKTDGDRDLYNKEFTTLASYITDLAAKDFNGVSLFVSTDKSVTTDSDANTFTMSGVNLGATSYTDATAATGGGSASVSWQQPPQVDRSVQPPGECAVHAGEVVRAARLPAFVEGPDLQQPELAVDEGEFDVRGHRLAVLAMLRELA